MVIGAPKDISDCRRFFLEPRSVKQRMYEALRAYFVERRPSQQVARDFGYTVGSFQVLCHHFRRESDPVFFVDPQHGPTTQPKKSAARELIIRLRKQNYSVYEISEALKERQIPLSPTAVREVLKEEGFAALPRRRDDERPKQDARPTIEPIANVANFNSQPRQFHNRLRRTLSLRSRPHLFRLGSVSSRSARLQNDSCGTCSTLLSGLETLDDRA
jgi:transposase